MIVLATSAVWIRRLGAGGEGEVQQCCPPPPQAVPPAVVPAVAPHVVTGVQELGEDHPATLNSMHTLAVVYDDQARYDEALPLLKRAQELNPREDVAGFVEQVERAARAQR